MRRWCIRCCNNDHIILLFFVTSTWTLMKMLPVVSLSWRRMSGIVRGLMFDASDELNLRWNGERDEITSVCPLLSLLLFLVRMDFEVWFRPVFGFVSSRHSLRRRQNFALLLFRLTASTRIHGYNSIIYESNILEWVPSGCEEHLGIISASNEAHYILSCLVW